MPNDNDADAVVYGLRVSKNAAAGESMEFWRLHDRYYLARVRRRVRRAFAVRGATAAGLRVRGSAAVVPNGKWTYYMVSARTNALGWRREHADPVRVGG